MTNEAAVTWTKWSQYQSSFSLMLVPHRPGVFALAEEVVSPTDASKRMLALVSVTEADDLARMISSMFHSSTDVQRRMGELKYLAAPYVATIKLLAQRDPSLRFVVPMVGERQRAYFSELVIAYAGF